MRIMGLDVGDKTIGIAISDPLFLTAQGRETIFRETIKKDIDRIIELILQEDVHVLVPGLPKNMNGTIGPQGDKTIAFINKLEKKITYSDRLKDFDVKIEYWDERLTTISATKMLIEADVSRKKRKKVIDKVAATYILQGYLDNMKRSNENDK